MADSVKWILELVDKMSAPGSRVEKTMRGITAGAKGLAGGTVGAAGKALSSLGKAVTGLRLGTAVESSILGAVGKVADLGRAGLKMAGDAQAFKDKTGIAFRLLLGTENEAGRVYKRLLDMANFFGEKPTETIEQFQTLMAKGFSAGDAEKAMQVLGDLRLISPDSNMEALIRAFGQIKSKPKLMLEELKLQLGDAGLNLGTAYEEIGKLIGVKSTDVQKAISAGKVDSSVGLLGIMNAIMRQTGSKSAGEQLEKMSKTSSGLAAKLRALPEQFILRMTADDSPMRGSLESLLALLDPNSENGKKIIGALNAAMVKVGETIKKWATPENIGKLVDGLIKLVEKGPDIIDAMITVGSAMATVVKAITSFRDNCRFLWAEFKRGGAAASTFVVGLASVTVPIFAIGAAVYTVAKGVADAVEAMWVKLSTFVKGTLGLGKQAMAGLATGMGDGMSNLTNAALAAAQTIPATTTKELEIHSPSRVMQYLGRMSTAGLAKGANDNGGPGEAIGAGLRSAVSSAGGSRGGGSPINVNIYVTVEGGGSEETGKQIARAVHAELVSFFEGAAATAA